MEQEYAAPEIVDGNTIQLAAGLIEHVRREQGTDRDSIVVGICPIPAQNRVWEDTATYS
jgi:hypothetical protein